MWPTPARRALRPTAPRSAPFSTSTPCLPSFPNLGRVRGGVELQLRRSRGALLRSWSSSSLQARSRGGQRRSASHRHTSVPVHACVHQGAATASTSAHWSGMCFPLTARARPRVGSVSEHATCRPAYSNPAARAPLSCSSTAYGHRMRVWRVRLHLLPTGAGAGGHLECAGAREGVHARSMEP